ncbi:MAG: flagellar basal body rod protein FlgF [Betaproteobacteria bacterium]|nr:flagellar basal body rod protein FlgF [Betaproteobacteria bacterium]
MDRVIYIAMTGARETTRQLAATTHNLANISTNGFKQELSVMRALPVLGDGAKTRAFVLETTPGTDFTPGAIQHTGRSMDVAVKGQGWIAVQDAAGREAYTRMGSLEVSPNGIVQTTSGLNVLADGSPLAVPPDQTISIGADGTVSAIPTGQGLNAVTIAGRIKLVNPEEKALIRGEDGLFRLKGGADAPADETVELASGALESSNVNPAEAMVNMVTLSRQFEMNMRVIRAAEDNDSSSNKLLRMS